MDDFRWAEAEKSAAAVASRSGAEKCYRLAATRGTSELYGSTDRRGGKKIKMRIHNCLEHVSAVPEAELMSAGVLARECLGVESRHLMWSCFGFRHRPKTFETAVDVHFGSIRDQVSSFGGSHDGPRNLIVTY